MNYVQFLHKKIGVKGYFVIDNSGAARFSIGFSCSANATLIDVQDDYVVFEDYPRKAEASYYHISQIVVVVVI